MAISSIHIEAGKIGFFSHNSRERLTTNSIFEDEENFCSCDNKTAIGLYKSELEKRTKAYLENHPTRKKLHSKTITHLSAIVNFNKEHTPEDIKKVCDHLEETFDTKVLQFSMHRDEGHILEDGTPDKNYHAHIEFIGLDSQGNSIKRNIGKKELIQLQTKVAELLNMQRGRNFNKEFKEFKQGLREEMPTKAKRLGTYEYKKAKEEESKNILAKQKDLTALMKASRKELQEHKATREQYAELEQLNKDLKAKIKDKDLTIEELNERLSAWQQKSIDLEKENTSLHKIREESEVEIVELQLDNRDLKNENKSLQEQKEVLEVKVVDLEEKINSRPNMSQESNYKRTLVEVNKEFDLKAKDTSDFKSKIFGFFSSLKKKITELKEIIIQKDRKIENLESDLRTQKYTNIALKSENETLKMKLEQNNIELDSNKDADELRAFIKKHNESETTNYVSQAQKEAEEDYKKENQSNSNIYKMR